MLNIGTVIGVATAYLWATWRQGRPEKLNWPMWSKSFIWPGIIFILVGMLFGNAVTGGAVFAALAGGAVAGFLGGKAVPDKYENWMVYLVLAIGTYFALTVLGGTLPADVTWCILIGIGFGFSMGNKPAKAAPDYDWLRVRKVIVSYCPPARMDQTQYRHDGQIHTEDVSVEQTINNRTSTYAGEGPDGFVTGYDYIVDRFPASPEQVADKMNEALMPSFWCEFDSDSLMVVEATEGQIAIWESGRLSGTEFATEELPDEQDEPVDQLPIETPESSNPFENEVLVQEVEW